jgi:hypothetical protein
MLWVASQSLVVKKIIATLLPRKDMVLMVIFSILVKIEVSFYLQFETLLPIDDKKKEILFISPIFLLR